MSSFQKGLCPVCRASVQVKNFKRHWNIQHQRLEKKRTYDEVFNILKENILCQDKCISTSSIDTYFEPKRRRLSEYTQSEPMTTIVQRNVLSDDDDQLLLSPSSVNLDIYLKKKKQ